MASKVDVALEDFENVGFLGRGAYGLVSLVKHKKTEEFFALKSIAKEKIRGEKHI